jgi:hypothetical protein
LIGDEQTIPFLKHTDVQTRSEEEADRVHNDLPIGVRIATDDGNFGTILDTTKENFGGVGGRIWATEFYIIQLERSWSWQTVRA